MRFIFWLMGTVLMITGYGSAEEFFVRFKTPKTFDTFMGSGIERLRLIKDLVHCRIGRAFSFGSFRGLTIDVSSEIAARIRKNPLVAEVVPNVVFNAFEHDDRQRGSRFHYDPRFTKLQRGAPRHLSRLSRRSQLPYNSNGEEGRPARFNYYYDKKHRGEGVNAYIVDTGIYKEHEDFQGRAIFGLDLTGEGPGDGNGHGTHVAGIVGSKSFGVAKGVTMVEVKALNAKGQGNLTTVISAMEFSVNHCRSSNRKGCVINLSLGAIRNSVINQAVKAAHEAGMVIVVAAGNSNINACWNSPASASQAISVGAFDDRTDTIAKFSNWGSCVDIFAPGVRVCSLSSLPPYKPTVFSGTSMASPSITGLAAILLDKGVKHTEIKDHIIGMSTSDVFQRRTLIFKPGTPNRVAFNGVDKSDDRFSNPVYQAINDDSLIDDLRSYQPGLEKLRSIADGGVTINNPKDDSPRPDCYPNPSKRTVLSP
ncbi:hypothetical protein HG536_0A08850 [Torulaspora globosa]|uniref:Peptidase S8/S53 domain-containing protein n=1 Tax=Torulaspora globosa TaxID=48254 RepID=A0A7G3ZC32_9SACH|nr:uncharacterized protein HG536_0A08850 [Torulaspora globosa]QLL31068.1 hypothetical protein HG536_0A08850 [Torulaspora globosa]